MDTLYLSLAIILLSYAIYKVRRKRVALEKFADSKYKKYLDLRKKTQVVSDQASCYPNTLGLEGAKMISEIQGILKEQEDIFAQLDYYFDRGKLQQVEDILSSFTLNQTSIKSERLLSEISTRIAFASEKATETKLPKIRKRNPTISSLKSAGLLKE